nr:T9SS type A sorting domain-containing protein [Saprospiraceae bacterium]
MITITNYYRKFGAWKVMSQHIFPSLTVAMLTLFSLFVVNQQMQAQTSCTMECPDDIVFNIVDDGCVPIINYELEFTGDCPTSGLNGFAEFFEPSNWTFDPKAGNGMVDESYAPDSIKITGSNSFTNDTISTLYCIDVTINSDVSFDWDYQSLNTSPDWDPFGYMVNGVFTQLTDDNGPLTQNGSEVIPLKAGDEFCYNVFTVDDILGEAVVVISNFSFNPPELTAGLESGSTFPIGTTEVSYSFDPGDGSGVQECSFEVTVNTPTPPNDEISCKQNVQVSVGSNCTAVVTPDEMLAGNIPCADQLHIVEIENRGTDIVDQDDLDQTLLVKVTRLDEEGNPSGNHCWGYVTVEDKLKPTIECSMDTVSCLETLAFTLPDASDNCGPVDTIVLLNQTDSVLCDDLLIRKIERTYVAIDQSGNQSDPCTQTLYVQRIDVDSIEFPEDFIAANDSALSCDEGFPVTGQGHPSPVYTGYPQLDSIEIIGQLNNICGISSGFSDQILTSSPCKTLIRRTWTIAEWRCDNSTNIITEFQEIEILDKEGPELICPQDITVTTSSNQNCSAGVFIPKPDAEDNCNEVDRIDIDPPNGFQFDWQGGIIHFNAGVNEVEFIAYDVCQNFTTCTMTVTVMDETPPVPICKENTVVSLTSDGTARVFAESFDNGSYDECGEVTFDVRRMNQGCDIVAPTFKSYVDFYCCDLMDNPIQIILRVTDESGNENECMVFVEVQDKLPASITCPPHITVSCQYPFDEDDLSVFGSVVVVSDLADLQNPLTDPRNPIIIDDAGNTEYTPQPYNWGVDGFAYDNCAVIVSDTFVSDIGMCGTGSITRTFYAHGVAGNLGAQCNQVITIENFTPFEFSSIDWPEDVMLVNVCDGIDTHPDETGYPEYTQGICDNVHYNYTDQTFYTTSPNDPVCYKIIRTWTVIDWCQFENGHYYTWTWEQAIKIVNNEAPEFTGDPQDISVNSMDPACVSSLVNLKQSATDDCTPPEDLVWRYDIDLDNDGTFNLSSTDPNAGDPTDASGEYQVGRHRIVWTVSDGCGNTSTLQQFFTVLNMTQPKVLCRNGIAIELMPMDTNNDGEFDYAMLNLKASFLDAGSYHNCGYDVVYSFSPDPTETTRLFDCDDIGNQSVALYVISDNGTFDVCIATVDVQDNNQACNGAGGTSGGGQNGIISGLISMEDGRSVNEVAVNLEGAGIAPSMTNTSGNYNFPAMSLGGAYEVVPERDVNPLEGVTTFDVALIQRHILGISYFNSPYQWIAADIDRNGVVDVRDISHLRRVILGTYDEFPDNTSWRFVDADYQFTAFNPLEEQFNETYMIPDFNAHMPGVDFIGVKIGDIDGSVDPSGIDGSDERSQNNPLVLNMDHQSFSSDELIYMEVKAKDFTEVDAFQFTLLFDKELLELSDVTPERIDLSEKNVGQQLISEGIVTFSWNDILPTSIEDEEVLFTLVFEAKSNGEVPDAINVSSMVTQTRAYVKGEPRELVLNFSGDYQVGDNFELYQNRPNPFKDETVIGFRMANDAPATLTIYDVTGKMVRTIERDFHKGYNEIRIDDLSSWTNQVYYYRLDTEGYSATKKMILIR